MLKKKIGLLLAMVMIFSLVLTACGGGGSTSGGGESTDGGATATGDTVSIVVPDGLYIVRIGEFAKKVIKKSS